MARGVFQLSFHEINVLGNEESINRCKCHLSNWRWMLNLGNRGRNWVQLALKEIYDHGKWSLASQGLCWWLLHPLVCPVLAEEATHKVEAGVRMSAEQNKKAAVHLGCWNWRDSDYGRATSCPMYITPAGLPDKHAPLHLPLLLGFCIILFCLYHQDLLKYL